MQVRHPLQASITYLMVRDLDEMLHGKHLVQSPAQGTHSISHVVELVCFAFFGLCEVGESSRVLWTYPTR